MKHVVCLYTYMYIYTKTHVYICVYMYTHINEVPVWRPMDLRCSRQDPYRFLAVTGTYDMLARGGARILPVASRRCGWGLPPSTAPNTWKASSP